MEFIDILDKNGNPTGEIKSKKQVHANGDWHRVICVCLVNSAGDILFQKRSPNKKADPNKWEVSASGHVSAGETALSAAVREFYEELGVLLPKEKFEHLFTTFESYVPSENFYANEVCEVYLVEDDIKENELNLCLKEVSAAKYIPYRKLRNILSKNPSKFVYYSELYEILLSVLSSRYPLETQASADFADINVLD